MRPLSEANMASRLGHTLRRRRAAAASGFSHAGSFRRDAELSTGLIRKAHSRRADPPRLAGPRSCVKTRARMLPSARGLLVLGARARLRRRGARLARGERAARLAPRPLLVARR